MPDIDLALFNIIPQDMDNPDQVLAIPVKLLLDRYSAVSRGFEALREAEVFPSDLVFGINRAAVLDPTQHADIITPEQVEAHDDAWLADNEPEDYNLNLLGFHTVRYDADTTTSEYRWQELQRQCRERVDIHQVQLVANDVDFCIQAQLLIEGEYVMYYADTLGWGPFIQAAAEYKVRDQEVSNDTN